MAKNGTALVTGAAHGIGRAAAEALSAAGYSVIATDRDAGALAALAGQGMKTEVLDVSDPAAIRAVIAAAGPLAALVNVAGIVHSGSILAARDDELDLSIEVNFKSMWHTMRAALPAMIAQRDGAVVNVASIGSSVKGMPDRVVYSATKAAVIGLTKAAAADLAGSNVRCNAVCPGPVDSPSMRDRLADGGSAARDAMNARVPMGRMGTAEEVAELILYLAGARWVTGQAYVIDGGLTG